MAWLLKLKALYLDHEILGSSDGFGGTENNDIMINVALDLLREKKFADVEERVPFAGIIVQCPIVRTARFEWTAGLHEFTSKQTRQAASA